MCMYSKSDDPIAESRGDKRLVTACKAPSFEVEQISEARDSSLC